MKIQELNDGYKGSITVLITNLNRGVTAKGAPYLSFTFQDKTGTMEAKYWNVKEEEIDLYSNGMLVEATGDVLSHKKMLQFRVSKLEILDMSEIDIYDYVKTSALTKEELKKLGSDTVYMEVSGDAEESIKSDNTAFVYVGTEELKTLDYLIATKTKVTYTKGEKLNLDDLEVTAVYTDGSKAKVTGYTTNVKNIDMSKTGKKQLEILYEEVGIGRKVVMPITVENAKPNTPKPDTDKKPSKKVKVTSIRLSGLSKQIAAGKKLTLKAAVLPKTASNKKLLWKSSNTKVATVTQGGVVTLKKKTGGKKVTITATATDGSKKYASWKITSMKGIVKKVKITGNKPVKAGKKLKLKAKITATKKANTKLLWTSANTKYATVNAKGIVTTKKSAKGKTVKIIAMATDGSGKKHTVKIKIK